MRSFALRPKEARARAVLSVIVILSLFSGPSCAPVAAQKLTANEFSIHSLSNSLLTIPDDIMPPISAVQRDQATMSAVTSDYKVIPILFVPNDATPNPFGRQGIDRIMQSVQRWYGEQLRDRSFSLEPARIVVGTHPLSYYYGSCYPSTSFCHWATFLWSNIFNDLAAQGYRWQSNRVLGVFFQHEGVGQTALGGGNQFLIGLDPNMVFSDCQEPGCASNVNEGGVAHELGHAFGLPHTAPDPEDSGNRSLMLFGFYFYPRANLANTANNPERDRLYASPFFNLFLDSKNGGFEQEDCLASWTVSGGPVSCITPPQLADRSSVQSGLSALQISQTGGQTQVRQTAPALPGVTYDLSGWLNVPAQSNSFRLQLRIQALSSSSVVLSTLTAADYSKTTSGWRRAAASMIMPSGTARARIVITAQTLSAPVYVDDIDLHPTQRVPPTPFPAFHTKADSVPTLRPKLMWANVTSATSFRLQAATNSNFSAPIVEARGPSPFYTLPNGLLAYDTRYFWRVKAINGVGEGGWSPTWHFIPRSASNYYSDEFETTSLNSAWSWVREDPTHHGLGGPLVRRGFGYMGIKTQAGDLLEGLNNAENLLLRNTPPGDFEASTTYDFWEEVRTEYQQGGLIIYLDDDNYIKLVRLFDGYHKLEFLAEMNGTIVEQTSTPSAGWVPIKISRIGNEYRGSYSTDGVTWRPLGQPVVAGWSNPKMGLIAYSQIAAPEIVAYFEYFRVHTR